MEILVSFSMRRCEGDDRKREAKTRSDALEDGNSTRDFSLKDHLRKANLLCFNLP